MVIIRSLLMIKICITSIYKPLRLTLNQFIENGVYPCEWKKANVVPIHNKRDKQTLKIIAQYLYFQLTVKFLKDSYITRCLVSFLIKA